MGLLMGWGKLSVLEKETFNTDETQKREGNQGNLLSEGKHG